MTVSSGGQQQPLAYRRADAARLLGLSLDSFERYVQPEIPLIRRGSIRLVPAASLEKWVRDNSVYTLPEGAA